MAPGTTAATIAPQKSTNMDFTLKEHLNAGFVAPFDRTWSAIVVPMKKRFWGRIFEVGGSLVMNR
jgi:hypothetical protein